MQDSELERARYDHKALKFLKSEKIIDISSLKLPLREPYLLYQKMISKYINNSHTVLEICAGMGTNTEPLLATGASIFATDISKYSLTVLEKRFESDQITCQVANMENLPFGDEVFDSVVCAGGLSYGDNSKVLSEIYRVLKPAGSFIAVDSLNHHPIYRLNRYIHYLRGHRSASTLRRMPTLKLISEYGLKFNSINTRFFGSISYLTPLISWVFGERVSADLSRWFDKLVCVKRSAFKFVMVVHKT